MPTPGPRRENSLKKGIGKLKKEDTTTTEQSEESADSGIKYRRHVTFIVR